MKFSFNLTGTIVFVTTFFLLSCKKTEIDVAVKTDVISKFFPPPRLMITGF